jgi:NitT/TauT family transport system substrate-binding protein
LIAGLRMTTPLYTAEYTKGGKPFRVSARNMAESFGMLQEFGGLEKNSGKAEDYYTNEFLPQ